jgi:hypothetical protein
MDRPAPDTEAATGSRLPILVFLGPTLPLQEASAALDATFLQPAAQGDVLLAAHAFHPRAMILIDGQFEDRPPVRHKEILWAIAQGIVMIGAASLGAMRAAELCDFGMIGVGAIYRWYRRWPLAPDDAVAVQSGPAEIGFPPLTTAMIDLQATFSRLRRRNLIAPGDRHRLVNLARAMNFRDRSFATVLRGAGWSAEAQERLRGEMVQRKRLDALSALRAAPRLAEKPSPRPRLEQAWIATNTFIRDLEAGGIDPGLLNNYRLPV